MNPYRSPDKVVVHDWKIEPFLGEPDGWDERGAWYRHFYRDLANRYDNIAIHFWYLIEKVTTDRRAIYFLGENEEVLAEIAFCPFFGGIEESIFNDEELGPPSTILNAYLNSGVSRFDSSLRKSFGCFLPPVLDAVRHG